eukprot:5920675-Prymnesium_polylepis.1
MDLAIPHPAYCLLGNAGRGAPPLQDTFGSPHRSGRAAEAVRLGPRQDALGPIRQVGRQLAKVGPAANPTPRSPRAVVAWSDKEGRVRPRRPRQRGPGKALVALSVEGAHDGEVDLAKKPPVGRRLLERAIPPVGTTKPSRVAPRPVGPRSGGRGPRSGGRVPPAAARSDDAAAAARLLVKLVLHRPPHAH